MASDIRLAVTCLGRGPLMVPREQYTAIPSRLHREVLFGIDGRQVEMVYDGERFRFELPAGLSRQGRIDLVKATVFHLARAVYERALGQVPLMGTN